MPEAKSLVLKKIAKLCLAGGVLYGLYIATLKDSEAIHSLDRFDAASIASIAALFFIAQSMFVIRLKSCLQVFQVRVNFFESNALIYSQGILNYLPLSAGTVGQSVYLRKVHGLEYSRFSAFFAADQLIRFLVFGILFYVALPFSGSHQEIPLQIHFVFLAFIIAPLAFFGLSTRGILDKFNYRGWLGFIPRLLESTRTLASSTQTLWVLAATQAGFLILLAFRIHFIYALIGAEVSVSQVLAIAAISSSLRLASLLPGNLGLREGLFTGSAVIMGGLASEAMLVALADRAISFLALVFVGTISTGWLNKIMWNTKSEATEK